MIQINLKNYIIIHTNNIIKVTAKCMFVSICKIDGIYHPKLNATKRILLNDIYSIGLGSSVLTNINRDSVAFAIKYKS